MKHPIIFMTLLFISVFCFAQQNSIPLIVDDNLYQIQVGAFKILQNAEKAFERLQASSLNPSFDRYLDFNRVMVRGIKARDVPLYIERIKNTGFSEILVRIDTDSSGLGWLPVSTAALPHAALREIAYRSVKVGETKSLADIVTGENIVSWRSSTPSTVSVDSYGNITGLGIGNGFISINETEYISIVVVPAENFYLVPESEAALLPENSSTSHSDTMNLTEYRTEPTFRLSYRFNNKGESRGASGPNGGIDILARGPNYEWLWTTYYQGGWFYDLNGVRREMINGYQKDANGVELTVKPEFVYDNGISYLQLRHILHNTGAVAVSGQKFGASADVMIHRNDSAALIHTPYGAYMTDSQTNPSLELMFVCESGEGITPVDTLWLGEYNWGGHLSYIYTDRRSGVNGVDSAIGFSYQNVELAPGEAKEFIVRFTLARTEK